MPGSAATLLGIAGFRGTIAPVYDLQKILGLGASQASRWLVIAAAAPVAFAFEVFEGQLRVSPSAIRAQAADDTRGFTTSFVETDGVLRPIIELSSVLTKIKT